RRPASRTGSTSRHPYRRGRNPKGATLMAITTRPVVLEQASQDFADATANPPYYWEGSPTDARKILDDVQAAPIDKLPVDDRWITVSADVGDVAVRIVRPPDTP